MKINESFYNLKIGIATKDNTWHTAWINFIKANTVSWAFECAKVAIYEKYGEKRVSHIWLIEYEEG